MDTLIRVYTWTTVNLFPTRYSQHRLLATVEGVGRQQPFRRGFMRGNMAEKMVSGMIRIELSIVVCSLHTQEQTNEEYPQNNIQRAKRLHAHSNSY